MDALAKYGSIKCFFRFLLGIQLVLFSITYLDEQLNSIYVTDRCFFFKIIVRVENTGLPNLFLVKKFLQRLKIFNSLRSEDASERSSSHQKSHTIWPGHQPPSEQSHCELMRLTGDKLFLLLSLS